jgi:serine/threonine-protein kinase
MQRALDERTPGSVLAGRYRVVRELGAGGMGQVLLCDDLLGARLGAREPAPKVAVKLLGHEIVAEPEIRRRFEREALLCAALESPFSVRFLDAGHTEAGQPYLVSEFLSGEPLSHVLLRGAVPVTQAVDWTIHACHALAEMHGKGIVHRDIKPANIMVVQHGTASHARLLDMGVALGQDFVTRLTRASRVMGTPRYMSPEQVDARPDLDGRSDLFSIGLVLFELLTGRPAFNAQGMQLLLQVVSDEVPRVASLRGDVPHELSEVIARTLDKDRTRRPGNAEELGKLLAPFASSAGAEIAARIGHSPGVLEHAVAGEKSHAERWAIGLGVAGVAALLFAAAFVGLAWGARTPAGANLDVHDAPIASRAQAYSEDTDTSARGAKSSTNQWPPPHPSRAPATATASLSAQPSPAGGNRRCTCRLHSGERSCDPNGQTTRCACVRPGLPRKAAGNEDLYTDGHGLFNGVTPGAVCSGKGGGSDTVQQGFYGWCSHCSSPTVLTSEAFEGKACRARSDNSGEVLDGIVVCN